MGARTQLSPRWAHSDFPLPPTAHSLGLFILLPLRGKLPRQPPVWSARPMKGLFGKKRFATPVKRRPDRGERKTLRTTRPRPARVYSVRF